MARSYDPSKYHEFTGRVTSGKTGPIPREERSVTGTLLGPLTVTTFLFCSTQPDQWAQPGYNTLTIDLSPLGITPWTVSASVTELSPPSTPWQGYASFQTLGVQLNQPDQFVSVYCSLQYGSPLPVALMMTIGHT
jgi:hypothetical protein